MRSVLFIVFVLFIPVSIYVLYQSFFTTELIQSNTPTQLPNGQLEVPVQVGQPVVVPDVTTLPGVVPDRYNNSLYFFNGGMEVSLGQDQFAISYDESSGFFNIILLRQPFSEARLSAESALLNALGITADDLCRLNYSVTVPGYVSYDASGTDYRFSFCEDAVAL